MKRKMRSKKRKIEEEERKDVVEMSRFCGPITACSFDSHSSVWIGSGSKVLNAKTGEIQESLSLQAGAVVHGIRQGLSFGGRLLKIASQGASCMFRHAVLDVLPIREPCPEGKVYCLVVLSSGRILLCCDYQIVDSFLHHEIGTRQYLAARFHVTVIQKLPNGFPHFLVAGGSVLDSLIISLKIGGISKRLFFSICKLSIKCRIFV